MTIHGKSRFVGFLSVTILSAVPLFALGNARDKMTVNFSHTVHVQGDVLPPGRYTIETMSGREANNNILQVYGKNNQKFKTSFTTIDAEKLNGAKTTHVTLLKVGGEYYLDKMFVAGRVYGYQVLLPNNVQSQANTGESEDVDGQSTPTSER